MTASFVAVIAAIASLQAPAQFNLVCSGQEWDRLEGGRARPYSVTLRIDLDAKRWCVDACPSGRTIAEITPDRIDLALERPDAGSSLRISSATYIDRINGTYREYFSLIGASVQSYRREASCELVPFTGMPQPRF